MPAFESHEGWGNRFMVLKSRQNWASPLSQNRLLEREDRRLFSPKMPVQPWKSGASAPRQRPEKMEPSPVGTAETMPGYPPVSDILHILTTN
jgi:hypothetical protein